MAIFCVSLVGEIKFIYREEKTEDGGGFERVSEKAAEGSKWLRFTSSLRD